MWEFRVPPPLGRNPVGAKIATLIRVVLTLLYHIGFDSWSLSVILDFCGDYRWLLVPRLPFPVLVTSIDCWLLYPFDHDFLVRKPVCKTLKMTTAQGVEMSVTVDNKSPIQDYIHPDHHSQPTYEGYVSLVFTGTISISMRFLLCYTA